MQTREKWGSRWTFIMAAAGSAVGLGNIWRFPYMAGQNGGGAFLMIYLAATFMIGFSIMLVELCLGRRVQLGAVSAFKKESKSWSFVGAMGLLAGLLILGFYPLIGGWSLAYVWKAFSGQLASSDAAVLGQVFTDFITGYEALGWMGLFMALNIVIVYGGVQAGIGRTSEICMPILFLLLFIIAIRSVTLEGAEEGLKFFLTPDFSKVTFKMILQGTGQAFFSLSLGMAIMVTYGSYLDRKERLPSTTAWIVGMDTLVGVLSGLAIIPAAFAFGMETGAGPSLVFITMPAVFFHMGSVGSVLCPLFFVLLALAALTSSISIYEGPVAYLQDERGIDRKKSVIPLGIFIVVLNVLSCLSLSSMSGVTLFGLTFFDVLDFMSDKVLLASGAVLLSIFAGWKIGKERMIKELTNDGEVNVPWAGMWFILIKYIAPAIVGGILVLGLIDAGNNAMAVTSFAVIALLALFSKKF